MTEIKCDYDGRIPANVWQRLEMVSRTQRLRVECVRFDKTRHGYHMVVVCRNRIGVFRLVAIQALLGSDWKREAFNLRRVRMYATLSPFWRTRWNVLYHRHYRRQSL